MSRGRILIVDDEPQIRRVLQRSLEARGYDVAVAEDGAAGSDLAVTWLPDVVVLDLVMPVRDGFDVLRELRAWSSMPVIVLSARGRENDKVEALDMGADDYLTKPFGIEELLARVRALLRRAGRQEATSVIEFADIAIDIERHIVCKAGEEVHLTPTEFDLLVVLASNVGKVMTHRQLLGQVWGDYARENAQQLRVYINYLRKKLETDPAHPVLITTEPGVGYRIRA